jgi:hypothetical protein
MERVHVDEREICLIQVKGAKLPRARLRIARGSVRCAGVRGFPLAKKENVNVASNSHRFGSRSHDAGHLHSR